MPDPETTQQIDELTEKLGAAIQRDAFHMAQRDRIIEAVRALGRSMTAGYGEGTATIQTAYWNALEDEVDDV